MILLVQPSAGSLEKAGIRLPLGLLYLATYLKKRNIRATIIDARVNKHWKKELCEKLKFVDFVGITCFIGPMISYSIEIAKFIKKYKPEVKVIFGGVHPTLIPEKVLQMSEIDIVVRHEGEEPLCKIMSGKNLSDICGISYRDENGKIVHNSDQKILPVDKIPIPDYSLVDLDKYSATTYFNEKSMSIMASRGCPYNCGFCYLSNIESWRPFPVDVVVKNAKILIKNFNIKNFIF